LLTGDISLKGKINDQMVCHFGMRRWGDIHVMQIPHHGSRKSWKLGLGSKSSHGIGVFCVPTVDLKGHHPHPLVVVDLQSTTVMFANDSQAVVHAFHIEAH
jgi:hypothetical protein